MPLLHHTHPPFIPPVKSEKVSAELQDRLCRAGINSFPIAVVVTADRTLTAEQIRELCHFGLRPRVGADSKLDATLYMSGMNMLGNITALPYIRYLESAAPGLS